MLRFAVLPFLFLVLFGAAPSTTRPAARPVAAPSSTRPADVTEALDHATAVCLAEIVSIKNPKGTFGDAPDIDYVALQLLKTSGEPLNQINIALSDTGGSRPSGRFVPHGPLFPNPLKVGQRYWFVFDGTRDWEKFPQQISAWWPVDSAPTVALEDAVARDRYAWHPHYDAKSDRYYGYKVDPKKHQFIVRVWTNGGVLWERTLEGDVDAGSANVWNVIDDTSGQYARNLPPKPNGRFLSTYASLTLAENNDFGIPATGYNLRQVLDFDSGKTAAVYLSAQTAGGLFEQQFNLRTGKPMEDTRQEAQSTGGLAVGANEERWAKVTVRHYDAEGRIASTEVFRYTGSQRIPVKTQ